MTKFDAQHLDEWLSAYLDGELTEKEAQLVEAALREDESARRRLADLRRTVSLVTGLPRRAAPPTLSEEILARLERTELLGDVEQPRATKTRRRRRIPMWTSLAAALGLTVLSGWWVFVSPQSGGTTVSRTAQRSAEPREAAPESPPSNATDLSQPADATTSRSNAPKSSHEERLASVERKKDATDLATNSAGPRPMATDSRNELTIAPPTTAPDGDSTAPVDLSTKLASGFDETKVRTHRYREESVRLRMEVRSGDNVEHVADVLRSQLVASGVSDLESSTAPVGNGSTKPVRFFQRGRPGDNFDGGESRQWIARVRPADLEAVLRETRTLGVRDTDVSLSAGALRFKGSANVRGALQSVASRVASTNKSETRVNVEADASGPAPSERIADRGSPSSGPLMPSKRNRVRTSDQWTALLDTIAQAFTSPAEESAAGSIEDASALTDGPATAVDTPPTVDGAKSRHAATLSNAESAKPDIEAAMIESDRSRDVATAPSSAGLVARRSDAAMGTREVALANRPAMIESTQPAGAVPATTMPASDASSAGDPNEVETSEEPLITLVIEVSVAPAPPSTSSGTSAPSPARNRPAKPPSLTPPSR